MSQPSSHLAAALSVGVVGGSGAKRPKAVEQSGAAPPRVNI